MASNITSSAITSTEAVTSIVTSPSSTFTTTSTSISTAIVTSAVPVPITSTTSTRTTTSTTPITSSTQAVTSTIIASSAPPTSTDLVTSTIAVSAAGTSSVAPVIITVTASASSTTDTDTTTTSQTSSTAAASSTQASLTGNGSNNSSSSSSLSPGGVTAIAVVVPVVVVALLVILGIFLWRRRKQRKAAEEQRRKEVEDYGYNPNSDPTIPVVGAADPEMSEDNSGYRGWGAATASTRKASTTLSGGHAQQLSDGGSAAYASSSPHYSDGNSGTGLMDNRRQTMGSDDFTATPVAAGAALAPAAGAMRRGPSNASSRYSGGAVSNHSEEPVPQIPQSYEGQGACQSYETSAHAETHASNKQATISKATRAFRRTSSGSTTVLDFAAIAWQWRLKCGKAVDAGSSCSIVSIEISKHTKARPRASK
ncbi:hypothetical protein AMS68_002934 [Peltaster fructicola]|uniref:REJ domain-containing protein n=1 Tax=Peltaster fructicola TaxID=286661 RepID=A0A6H0XRN2_9PEZI|nr:hypothetical protein AMS68_002934 [Peltaster fructicola]